ncbi:SCO family protein [Piscinibacter sp.]|jgi:cytochrome oxidase Cu insertion factor (SCO1/SenC/PrrC family)|uniref:SCO family protein n=1 Tax=Piscinibacter sp. TaxID=1903157 RepID=UPI003559F061
MRYRQLAALLVATVFFASPGRASAQDMVRSDGRWLDDRAQPYKLESLHGAPTILTMAYGACRRVCSTSLRVMQSVQALADERHLRMNFVVVGIDPHEDTPADWAAFRIERKLNRPNWQFLSGDEASTRQLAQQLGVRYWRYGEHTMHDFKIVLLSPEGRVVRSIDTYDQSPASLLP